MQTNSSWRLKSYVLAGMILYMRPANERRCYNVTPSLIGWAHSQNDPWQAACGTNVVKSFTTGNNGNLEALTQEPPQTRCYATPLAPNLHFWTFCTVCYRINTTAEYPD